MANRATVWGVHMGKHVSDRPVEGGYVAIGWHELGDGTQIGSTREAYKQAMIEAYPTIKPGAIPVDAGTRRYAKGGGFNRSPQHFNL